MITTALINMKGGVGKTTLAVNMAWMCHLRRNRVLLIDLDPQFNATQYTMTFDDYDQHKKQKGTVLNILQNVPRPKSARSNLETEPDFCLHRLYQFKAVDGRQFVFDLLPSELALAFVIKNPQGVEFRLLKFLERLSTRYDYVFIDCAPTDTVLTTTALIASNFVLIPMKPDRFSILGHTMMKQVVQEFKSTYPDPKQVQDLGVIFTIVSKPPTDIETECMEAVRKEASYVFESQMPHSSSYQRSVRDRSPITFTKHARESPKNAMRSVMNEFFQRIKVSAMGKTS